MKKNTLIKIFVFQATMLLTGTMVSAQQLKPSNRSFTEEINKIRELKKSRDILTRKIEIPKVEIKSNPARQDRKEIYDMSSNQNQHENEKSRVEIINKQNDKPSDGPMKTISLPERKQKTFRPG